MFLKHFSVHCCHQNTCRYTDNFTLHAACGSASIPQYRSSPTRHDPTVAGTACDPDSTSLAPATTSSSLATTATTDWHDLACHYSYTTTGLVGMMSIHMSIICRCDSFVVGPYDVKTTNENSLTVPRATQQVWLERFLNRKRAWHSRVNSCKEVWLE